VSSGSGGKSCAWEQPARVVPAIREVRTPVINHWVFFTFSHSFLIYNIHYKSKIQENNGKMERKRKRDEK
jgi:hypothetical protein